MAEQQRRLTTIVAMDVAGYSRLMGSDEHTTLNRLNDHRAAIDPIALEHGGRIVGTAGDGILIEFPSVVEAVNFALRCQAVVAERNAEIPDDEKMLFRIGINLGDVLVQDDDLFGDGVNVAARIEALAEPGGICISRAARDQIRDKLEVTLEDQGEVEVKNIARPVRVFRLSADADVIAAIRPVRSASLTKSTSWKEISALATLIIIAVIGGGAYWWWQKPVTSPANPAKYAYELPDKPSIAVLPFNNISNDPEQEYFVDGMTEDLITDLSKISGLFVVARNSVFTYKGKTVKVQQVAEELGVRYVLEGSVRRVGNQVRINAQLIDAIFGGHVWADRFDGELTDVFALQDKATAKVVAALSIQLSPQEAALKSAGGTTSIEAYDAYLKGWSYFRRRTPEDYVTARALFDEAVLIDPDFGQAWAALASLYLEARQRNWWSSLESNRRSFDNLQITAVENARENPTALGHRVYAELLAVNWGRLDEAFTEVQKALSLDPNDSENIMMLAAFQGFFGDTKDAIRNAEKAMRLDPHYPAYNLYQLGYLYFDKKDFTTAIELFERSRTHNPNDFLFVPIMIAAYAHANQLADARKLLSDFETKLPTYTTTLFAADPLSSNFALSWLSPRSRSVREGLLKAGAPELPKGVAVSQGDLISGGDLTTSVLGRRNKGYIGSDIWTADRYPDGRTEKFWNGTKYFQGRTIVYEEQDTYCDLPDPLSPEYRKIQSVICCKRYLNKDGTNSSLNEIIAICNQGIYPFSQFELPED